MPGWWWTSVGAAAAFFIAAWRLRRRRHSQMHSINESVEQRMSAGWLQDPERFRRR
jgi:hypothetical protein